METACATCPGHCCVAFYLPAHHERVAAIRGELTDGDQIAEMIIPLSLAEANERLDRFGADREYGAENEGTSTRAGTSTRRPGSARSTTSVRRCAVTIHTRARAAASTGAATPQRPTCSRSGPSSRLRRDAAAPPESP